MGVVILDWNGGAETLRCVESVLATGYAEMDVYLVDNASRAPVLEEVKRRHPQVTTIANPTNLGYAGGNNVGIRAARGAGADLVLVLNYDATLARGAIEAFVAAARGDARVAAVGAKVLRADDPRRLWMAYGEITYHQSLVRLVGEGERDGARYDVERDVDWVSGCAILLSGAAIDALGGFDEEFFAYHEEVDWCARARASGWRVVYAPAAVVTHRGEASSGGGSYVSRKQYLAGRNMVLFVRRHASAGERLRFASFFLGSLPLQYLRRALTGEQEGVALKLRGARDALRGRPLPRAELGLDG